MIFQDKNKRPNPWGAVWGLLIVLALAFAYEVYGYELPDRFRKWNVDSIEVYYNDEGCTVRIDGLWRRAAHKWGVIDVIDGGGSSVEYDHKPTLWCGYKDQALLNVPSNVEIRIDYVRSSQDNLVLGTAHSYWISGSMVDCDIRLHPYFVNEENVEETMLHEFGHCLGIAHSDNRDAIMHYSLRDGAYLHADDLLAACDLYGVCPMWDTHINLAIPKTYIGDTCYYGYLVAGGIWPNDIEAVECDVSE